MMSLKLAVLLIVAAIVAFASSAEVTTTYDIARENTTDGETTQIFSPGTIDNNDNKVDVASQADIDGIPLKYLTQRELNYLLDMEDSMLMNELDIIVARKIVKARKDGNVHVVGDIDKGVAKRGRQRRWVGLIARLLPAARQLFQGAIRAPKQTISGTRITQQYTRKGNFNDANRQFDAFRPENVRSIGKNGISGRTGKVGDHTFTVRDGSKQGSPTLEIRSPKPTGTFVRKMRYEQ